MKKILSLAAILLVILSTFAMLTPEIEVHGALEASQLTTNPYNDNTPSWSPDGSNIVYMAKEGSWDRCIWVMNSDGSDKTQLTSGNIVDVAPSYSPDGTKIAFMRWGLRGDYFDIMIMDADGSNLQRITDSGIPGKREGSYHRPKWSKDGQRLVFVYAEGPTASAGPFWICTMNRDGTDLQILGQGLYPRFCLDDTKIIYNTEEPRRIALMNTDGTNVETLTAGPSDYAPHMSLVSERIVFVSSGNLCVMNRDGCNLITILGDGNNSRPEWSPTEEYIVYESCKIGGVDNWDIWKIAAPSELPSSWQLSIKLSGQHDYLPWENVKVKVAALVADVNTMELVSDANVTIAIYDPENNLWINDTMTEKLNTGIYLWESNETVREIFWHNGKGIYVVHGEASFNDGPTASDILTFHIDPPPGGKNNELPIIGISLVAMAIIASAAILIKKKRKS